MNKFFQLFKIKDLRNRIFRIIFFLVLFRLMANIPIPGINALKLKEFFASNQFFGLFNIFAGGGLSRVSIAMLGVAPYITAVIILQLLTVVFPRLKEIYYEEGNVGRAKFNRYSRYLTVPLAILQSFGFLKLLSSQGVLLKMSFGELLCNVVIITAGSVVLMWIGEVITEYKLGNGISLLIFGGIIASVPSMIYSAYINYSPSQIPSYLAFIVLALLMVTGVVFVTEAERRIPISYAKRVRGTKMYGGISSYLPLRVLQAGVMPIIFAISMLLFPQFFTQIVSAFSPTWGSNLTNWLNPIYNNLFLYSFLYFILVVVFTYFYTAITFDPKEISKNLQQSGGFVLGIRPGEATGEYIRKLMSRVTLFGAIFLGLIAVAPSFMRLISGVPNLVIGGTSLLIVVAVALETVKQINSQLILREYEGFF